ncbi:MAG: glycosyltransferase family 4 protein [Bacteroidetes bacterium]|nr:glycosyltransferase family 4 protein [Bacteroidota bacterium]
MRILILHQFFNTPESGGPLRSYYLATALKNAGHEVVVITTSNQGESRTSYEGIAIHYLDIPYDNRFGFYRRIAAYLHFAVASFLLVRKIGRLDYCYAISAPLTVGTAAKWILFWYDIPYFFEVGDLWPDAPIQMGIIRNPVAKTLLYQMERAIYRDAEAVVALSSPIADAIRSKVPDQRVEVITNFSDCEFFQLLPKTEVSGWDNKLVIAYIGAMGVANGLEYLLECANVSRNAKLQVHFLLCGDGAVLEMLKSTSKDLNLDNITFLPFTNRDGVKRIMDTTDAVFICYKNVPILETGSPHKFFDGLAAGKMIILNVRGWMEREVLENSCGIALDPYRASEFASRMAPVVRNVALLRKYQIAARRLAELKYSRTKLGQQFVELFEAKA